MIQGRLTLQTASHSLTVEDQELSEESEEEDECIQDVILSNSNDLRMASVVLDFNQKEYDPEHLLLIDEAEEDDPITQGLKE